MPVPLKDLMPQKNSSNNYTMIDEVFLQPMTPINRQPIINNGYPKYDDLYTDSYSTSYNSDNATGVILPQAKAKMGNYIPKDYLQNVRSNYPPVYQQRDRSLSDEEENDRQRNPLVGQTLYPPSNFIGVTPPMKNALRDDVSVEMYKHTDSGQSCIDTYNHVMNCPMCSRYFKCDTKIYNVIIIMLIILFATVMYCSYKEENKRK